MKRGGEQQPVGPSPEDVQRANASRGRLKGPGLGFWGKTADVLAGIALLGAGGLGLKSAAENASQKPPQTTPDQRGPNLPPEGVTFPEGVRADSSAPSTFRVFLPQVTKQVQEAPLRILREFGNLQTDKVLFINKGEKAWVEMGDPELYRNMLWIRDNYAMYPDIKRVIIFYENYRQLQTQSGIQSNYGINAEWYPETRFIGAAERQWQADPDGTIKVHISIPDLKSDVDKNKALAAAAGTITDFVYRSIVWSNPDGSVQVNDRNGVNGFDRRTEYGRQKLQDFKEHPITREDTFPFIVQLK